MAKIAFNVVMTYLIKLSDVLTFPNLIEKDLYKICIRDRQEESLKKTLSIFKM